MPAGLTYSFGPFRLDAAARRLTRDGNSTPIADRHLGVLLHLLAHAGEVVSKDALIDAVWKDVAVTDNSLEQAVSALRRLLGNQPEGQPFIQTVPRQGYRFAGEVEKRGSRATDEALDALLAPHRAWIEGRAALETLEGERIVGARHVFEEVLARVPDQAPAHVGLANACVLQFEMTRADAAPNADALEEAARHAQEACRLEPSYGEAWATLGFVLDRTGRHADALAASRRAVTLEPDNWRHHLRLGYVGWGEERLRSGRRVLALLPGFPLAHWLMATVHVARRALDEAERELAAGLAGQAEASVGRAGFSGVALHWLRGLILLARGDEDRAVDELERELSNETSGHLYARECCANSWYAIGAIRLRQGRRADAVTAFAEAASRVPGHVLAQIGRAAAESPPHYLHQTSDALTPEESRAADRALCEAAGLALAGQHAAAARLLEHALDGALPGSALWLLPVEPLLNVAARPDVWAPALARVARRAA